MGSLMFCFREKSLVVLLACQGDWVDTAVPPMLVLRKSTISQSFCILLDSLADCSPSTSILLLIELMPEVPRMLSMRFFTDSSFLRSTMRATLGDRILSKASLVVP